MRSVKQTTKQPERKYNHIKQNKNKIAILIKNIQIWIFIIFYCKNIKCFQWFKKNSDNLKKIKNVSQVY